MAAAEILAWIAKTIGGQLVKDGMGRTVLKRENRALKKALLESQERRENLDAYHARSPKRTGSYRAEKRLRGNRPNSAAREPRCSSQLRTLGFGYIYQRCRHRRP